MKLGLAICLCLSLQSQTFLILAFQIFPWAGGKGVFLPLLWFCQTVYLYCLMCFFLFCEAFSLSAVVLSRAALTWLTDPQSVYEPISLSLCLCSLLLLFSLSDTIKQKHISKPSERGIFLSFLFTPVCLVFCLHCLFLFFVCYHVDLPFV